jgi:succinoglycan biosynthesis transport protein ExoP
MFDRAAEMAGLASRPSRGAGTEETASPAVAMLGALVGMVRRRRLSFALPVLLVPLLAFLAIQQVAPRYTAQADVIYDPSSYSVRELQSILRSDPTTDAVMASQLEIVRGLRMAERLSERFDLARSPEFNPALRHPSWPRRMLTAATAWLVGGGNPQSERQIVASAVQKAIEAKTLKTSRVIEIAFTAANPFLAADGANALAGIYIGDQLALKADAVRRANDWLDTRVGDLRREVTAGEDRMAVYRAQSGLVAGVQAGLPTERISRLTAELVQARDELAAAEARLASARGHGTAATQATIAPSVVALRAQQDELSAQMHSALARLGPRHPTIASLRDQVADLKRAAQAETDRIVAAMAAEVEADRAHVSALEDELQAARAEVDRAAQSQIPLNAMQRDADAARTLLQAVLERMQQTAQQTAIEIPDARLVSQALPPERPSAHAAAAARVGRVRRLLRPAARLSARSRRREFPERGRRPSGARVAVPRPRA